MRFISASRLTATALLASTALASPGIAQDATSLPAREVVDRNDVNPATGKITFDDVDVTIGPADMGLAFHRFGGKGSLNPYVYALYAVGTSMRVVVGERTLDFDLIGGVYVNKQGTGETLTNTGTIWTLTLADGTVVRMDSSAFAPAGALHYHGPGVEAVAQTITFPNKRTLELTYKAFTVGSGKNLRLQSVRSSNGYQAKLEYANNTTAPITKVTLLNNAVDWCLPSADTCTFSRVWPSLTFATGPDRTTDSLNRTTTYTYTSGRLTAVRRPSSAIDNTTITYGTDLRVSSVTTDGRTWNYAWSLASPLLTATITNPDSSQRVIVSDINVGLPVSVRDELNRITSYTYDTKGRLTQTTFPEGNKVQYTYDARGNITQTRRISKTPGTPADIVETASYPASCTNPLTCNKPSITTDARGSVTNYTYNATHGGVLTVTQPAPTTGAVRPQVRYTYATKLAYLKASNGTISAYWNPIHLPTASSACQTLATCAGAADEVKTTVDYGPQVNGTPNNLLPISISRGSGNGALTATTANTYDDVGNLTHVDGPLSGAADTTRILYDLGRQVTGPMARALSRTGPRG